MRNHYDFSQAKKNPYVAPPQKDSAGIDKLVKSSRKHLSSILQCSGKVLYSSAATLRPGKIYLLGHNPGGSPDEHSTQTVGASLGELPAKVDNDYLDERWIDRKKLRDAGDALLQRRAVWLLENLGFDVRSVAASNLLFSRSEAVVASSFFQEADLCWPVHELILGIVKPEVVIVFGNSKPSPYDYLKKRLGLADENSFSSGHGNWSCRTVEIPGRFRLIGLPHLSRYDITRHRDVVEWIRPYLN